jgi:uncharacterized protein (UPF0332 family)
MRRIERAEEKLQAAKYLSEGGYFEDSISRSYYCMFHAAKALLESEDIQAITHSGLIRMIGKEFVKKDRIRKSLGRAISIAEEDRETADYDIEIEFTEEEAEKRIQDAEEFLSEAKKLT